ncbi:hypothetical protein [Flavobacterium muglaense]|uniref:Uncharacterized protein n=1 Tax=Flavobacterium muglaense TaxID=2764716 RepID=A0A923SGK1_9FLAO|nr:hypothetical protein [Flavobacterium muglaense]MBC5839169.1 hypothetical protein [Flavobacterium muglaense]MBC5845665.1 hypothetical protein [Flavobacterium muglaense]
MKPLFTILLLIITGNLFAQTPCDFSTNVTDSIGTYKSTTEYLMSEKVFAGNSSYIFYSLALTDGLPTLNIQLIQKSKGFLKVNCFDNKSKLFLQLNDGKIITLIHTNQENCGTLIRDDNGFDNRVTTGTFMFLKGSMEDLKNSPLSLMRIKYLTETEDFIIKKEFKSELTNLTYTPDTYFINNLHCVE